MIRTRLRVFIILVVMGFLTFSNGLSNPFMVDDHAFYEEKLLNIKFLPLHFLPDKNKALRIEGESADPFYRPLATVVPMLSLLTFKKNTTGHHSVNLVLMVLAGWCIYMFLEFLKAPFLVAFLASVFYVIHPINGVIVNYITASVFAVQVMLMLGALYFLFKPKTSDRQSKFSFSLSMFFYLLATWCHETALLLPAYAFVLYVAMQGLGDSWAENKNILIKAWDKTWPLFIMLGIILLVRVFFVGALQASILDKIKMYDMSFSQYLATWTMLLTWYLSRLFWYKNVVLIMAHQPLTSDIGLWVLILCVLVLVAAFLIWFFRRDKLMFLGLSWFVLGFVPFTLACFFQPIHGLMIEPHWFLFPVIGFFIVVASVIAKTIERQGKLLSYLGRVALCSVVFCSVFFSRWHNWVWGDEVRYCQFWLSQSPSFVAVNAYLAKAYEFRKEFDTARAHYKIILGRGYKDEIAYTNLGLMDMQEGKWESAAGHLQKVLDIDPKASVAVSNMGVVYFNNGDYKRALEYFKQSRLFNKYQILPYLNIAKTYQKLKHEDEAIAVLEEALSIAPSNEHVLIELIQAYLARNDTKNILRLCRLILNESQNPISLQNVSVLFNGHGFSDDSRRAYLKAQRIINHARLTAGRN